MTFALWLLIPVALVLGVGLGLSFYLTRRHYPAEIHTPAEYGLEFEEVPLRTADGLTLRGWWIPAPGSERAVVILHGHGGSMDGDVHRAPMFHRAGYGVLLLDFRAHGRSPGRLATFGYRERWDVLAAVEFLKSRGVQRIGLLGFSYGGMASMLAAPICPDVHAVVTDGGPARLRSAIIGRGGRTGPAERDDGFPGLGDHCHHLGPPGREPLPLRAGALGGANRPPPHPLHPRRPGPILF